MEERGDRSSPVRAGGRRAALHLQVDRQIAEPREGFVGRRKESEWRLASVDVVAEEVSGLERCGEPPETQSRREGFEGVCLDAISTRLGSRRGRDSRDSQTLSSVLGERLEWRNVQVAVHHRRRELHGLFHHCHRCGGLHRCSYSQQRPSSPERKNEVLVHVSAS